MLRRRLESWLNRMWYGRSPAWLVFWPLSLLFRLLIAVRSTAYKVGFLRSHTFGVPVIVAGNLTVGGAGKTPLVLYLAQLLKDEGWQPGILSRGYGRKSKELMMASAESTVRNIGDEALMMFRSSQLPVCVSADRAAGAQALIEAGATVIVSDDGLQHYAIKRDIEIVVVDGRRGFGNGRLLPAGPLREPLSRLNSVDFQVWNRAEQIVASHEPGVHNMWLEPEAAYSLHGDRQVTLGTFSGQTVHAVAGIANPEKFFEFLSGQNITTVKHPFPDHHHFSVDDLDFGDDMVILMTEKDAVKCEHLSLANAWSVNVRAQCDDNFRNALLRRLQDFARPANRDAGNK